MRGKLAAIAKEYDRQLHDVVGVLLILIQVTTKPQTPASGLAVIGDLIGGAVLVFFLFHLAPDPALCKKDTMPALPPLMPSFRAFFLRNL